ncbi:MAG: tRNA dihydrouridine synthase DusB, partial [Planctomycetota bacterium]
PPAALSAPANPQAEAGPETLRFGSLELPTRWLLSPLAGFTNLEFRRIARSLGGVGLGTTDLVNARGLLEGSKKSLELIETGPGDSPFAVQLFGHEPQRMAEAAKLVEQRGVDSIDINMGCPVDRICKTGAGSKLMKDSNRTTDLVSAVVEAVDLPVTVKMRLGWDENQLTAPAFARRFEDCGVVAVMIHGRTRAQGFSGTISLPGIAAVCDAVQHIPVIGNGDVRTVADAERMLNETGCDGVSVGRGALANPWIFRQLVQWETTGKFEPPGTFADRMALLKRQFGDLCERHGEERAVPRFRKMAHWYLKAMKVRAELRGVVQQAKDRPQFEAALQRVWDEGPTGGVGRTGLLPDMHVPVPKGPVERW